MLILNSKHVQHVKINLAYNFKVNLITHLEVIAEMEKLYRGPYIDAYCQVWFHLAKLFQRRRLKYEKFNGRTTDANTSHGPLGQVS
jgi:hypothetical protein